MDDTSVMDGERRVPELNEGENEMERSDYAETRGIAQAGSNGVDVELAMESTDVEDVEAAGCMTGSKINTHEDEQRFVNIYCSLFKFIFC